MEQTTDRNQQYGTIAIKNDFLNKEQFDECYSFFERLQKKNPDKELKVEDILFEKGYISDAQHQVVLQVMKRLIARRGPTSVLRKPVTCRHCGTPNAAEAQICESCQGALIDPALKLEVLEEDVRTCPNCAGDLAGDALQCKCGLMFCPQCRGIRNPAVAGCGICGFLFPDSGLVEAIGGPASGRRSAARGGGAGLSAGQLAAIAGVVLLLLAGLFFALSGGENTAELEELFGALEGQRAAARKALHERRDEQAREKYGLALDIADKIKRRTKDAERLDRVAQAVAEIEKKLAEFDRRSAARRTAVAPPPKKKKTPPRVVKKTPPKKIPPKKIPPKKIVQQPVKQPLVTTGTPRLPVPPARLDDAQVERALEELKSQGLALPRPPRVAAARLVLLFLTGGDEVVGQLEKETPQLLILVDLAGRRRSIGPAQVAYRVKGVFYDRGPAPELVGRTGRPIPGKLVKIDEQYAEVERNGATEPILRNQIRPLAYYRAYRYLNTPKEAEGHIRLGRLCLELGLREEAQREFLEAGRLSPDAMLRVLPHADPALYLKWRLGRKAGAPELLELARWAGRAIGPRGAVQSYEAAVLADRKLEFNGEVQLAIAQAWIEVKEFDRARRVITRVRGSLPGPLRENARRMLELVNKQQKTATQTERKDEVAQVMKVFVAVLKSECEKVAREVEDYAKVVEYTSGAYLIERIVEQTAKQGKFSKKTVQEAFGRRLQHPDAYKPLKVEYGAMTWMVKTPDTLTYEYGTDKVAAEKNTYWNRLNNRRAKVALVLGLFAEEKLKVEASTRKCPVCKGRGALSGFSDIQLQLKRMDGHCRGTGAYRTITIR